MPPKQERKVSEDEEANSSVQGIDKNDNNKEDVKLMSNQTSKTGPSVEVEPILLAGQTTVLSTMIELISNVSRLVEPTRGVVVKDSFKVVQFSPVDTLEIKFETVDSIECLLDFETYGAARSTYVIRKPLSTPDFRDWDGYFQYGVDCINGIIDECRQVLHISSKEVYRVARAGDMQIRGFPWNKLANTPVIIQDVANILAPFIEAVQNLDGNWQIVNIARPKGISDIRNGLLDFGDTDMRRIRDWIDLFLKGTNGGVTPSRTPHVLYPNSVLHPCGDPRYVNTVVRNLPNSFEFSVSAILSLTGPEIELCSLTTTEIQISSQGPVSVLGSLGVFTSVALRPSHEVEIRDWVSALMCPGMIVFTISDLSGCDLKTVLRALAIRLTFNYHENPRYCDIREGYAREVDNVLAKYGVACGFFRYNPNAAADAWPLDTVVGVGQDAIDALNLLRTTADGNGWRDDGIPYDCGANDHNRDLYPGIMRRRNIGVNCSDHNVVRQGEVDSHVHGRRPFMAVNRYFDAMRVKGASTDMKLINGLRALFRTWIVRLASFYIQLNWYLSKHWYTGFRPRESDFLRLRDKDEDNVKESTISADAALIALTHLNGQKELNRYSDPVQQMKAESRVVMEVIRAQSYNGVLLHANEHFGLNLDCWSLTSRIKIITTEDSLVRRHLENVRTRGTMGDFFRALPNLILGNLGDVYRQASRLFTGHPELFGLIHEFTFFQHIAHWTVAQLEETCVQGRSLINNREDFPDGLLKWRCPQLLAEALTGKIVATLVDSARDNGITIVLPIQLQVAVSNVMANSSSPLSFVTPDSVRNANAREIMRFGRLTKTIVFLGPENIGKLDNVFGQLSTYESNHVQRIYINQVFSTYEEWLQGLPNEFARTRVLSNGTFPYYSVFDMYEGGRKLIST